MIKSSIGKYETYDKVDHMKETFNLRLLNPADGDALAGLAQNSPDTGLIGMLPQYQLDAYQVLSLRYAHLAGVVAETPAHQGLVGMGAVSLGRCCFEGAETDVASLHSLMVHPQFRRQGLAAELARWRYQYALQQLGDEALIAASIQHGNTGSLATAQRWCQQLAGEVQGSVSRMSKKSPLLVANITVRPAESTELEAIVHHQNNFYQGYNFYSPDTPEKLSAWLGQTPFDRPFRHYLVAVDGRGNLLAGLVLKEQSKLVTMQVSHMPAWVSLLNKFLKVVPADGLIKQLAVERFWYTADQQAAANFLWEMIRWQWRDRGSGLICFYDPRGPLPQILNLPAWMPKSKFTFAVAGPRKMSEDRPVYHGV